MPISRRNFSGKLVEKSAVILTYFKDFEGNLAVRVSGGDLGKAEAPTEPAGETKEQARWVLSPQDVIYSVVP